MKRTLSLIIVLIMICLTIPVSAGDTDNYVWRWNDTSGVYMIIDGYESEPARYDFFFPFDSSGEFRCIIPWTYGSLTVYYVDQNI